MSVQSQIASDGMVYLTCPRPGCGASLRVTPARARSWVTCAAAGCGHRFVLNLSGRPARHGATAEESLDFTAAAPVIRLQGSGRQRRDGHSRRGHWARRRWAIMAGVAVIVSVSGLAVMVAGSRQPKTPAAPPEPIEVVRAADWSSDKPRRETAVPLGTVPVASADLLRVEANVLPKADPPTEAKAEPREPEPTPAATAEPDADVIDRVRKATALVEGAHGSGSGFLIRPGILVTNAHVIDDELLDDVKVRFVTLEQAAPRRLNPVLLYKNVDRDLAIFRVESASSPLELAEPGTNLDGLSIAVVGNPRIAADLQGIGRVSRGTLKAPAQWRHDVYFELHAQSAPGNSGGPVVDAKTGRVVGVLTGGVEGRPLSLCIPFEELVVALDRVAALDKAGTGNKHAAARHYLDYIARHMPLVERCARQAMELRMEQLRREAGSRKVDRDGPASPVERIDAGKFDFKGVFASIQRVYDTHHQSNGEIPVALRRATAVRLEACARMFNLARGRTETETSFRKNIEQRRYDSETAVSRFNDELKKYRDAVERQYRAGN